MKTTLRFWLKDRKSFSLLMVAIVFRLLTAITVARITLTIGNAVANYNELDRYLPELAILYIGSMVFAAIQVYCRSVSSNGFYTNMMDKFCKRVIDLEYSLYVKYSPAYISSLTDQIGSMNKVGDQIYIIASSVIFIAVTLISMHSIAPGITTPMVIVHVFCGAFFKYAYSKYKDTKRQAKLLGKERFQELEEVINAFQEVRSFCTQKQHGGSIYRKNHAAYEYFKKTTRVDLCNDLVVDLTDMAGVIVAIIYAAIMLRSGAISQAVAMSLVIYAGKLQQPMVNLAATLSESAELGSMMPEFEEFMSQNLDSDGTLILDQFEKGIEIEDLSFSYDSSNGVLSNINLSIKKGQKIGICGSSGGGKSTLIKLLNRFYTSYSGAIKIDGIDIKDLTAASLRKCIGMVHQENHMFNDTIYNNIKYGSPNATEYEVIEAAKKASLYDFIQTMPDKFNTMVGNRGLTLSGGQKQRVALARLFLRNPSIILLDEATSALDNESEAIIQDSLRLFEDKTIITIAHRLSTIADSDKIIVIDGHHIAESGTHDELVAAKGIYNHLVEISKKQR